MKHEQGLYRFKILIFLFCLAIGSIIGGYMNPVDTEVWCGKVIK